jgi:hypothetical protein
MIRPADLGTGDDEKQHHVAAELTPEAMRLVTEVVDRRTGRLRLLPAAFWKGLDPKLVIQFATATGRWCIVTTELVAWLEERIAGRKAIEIGDGNADLGFHLGIPQTDSCARVTDPAARLRALQHHHPLPSAPPNGRQLDGLAAAQAMWSDVVVAAWPMRQRNAREANDDSYHLDVGETALLREADYICIGNRAVHMRMRIMALPHTEHAPPWLVSRAHRPEQDRIWAWKRWRGKRGRQE